MPENIKISPVSPKDFLLSSYAYALPEELIAQYPGCRRGSSRLYVLRRGCPDAQEDALSEFQHLLDYLPEKCLFVANNSRVIPARLFGQRLGGGKFEFLLLTPPPVLEAEAVPMNVSVNVPADASANVLAGEDLVWRSARAKALLRPVKKLKIGQRYPLADGLAFSLLEKEAFGQADVRLEWQGNLLEHIEKHGLLPLPPYIKREPESQDLDRYQTVFSNPEKSGSVAAPTAGLHFTEQMRQRLLEAGHEFVELTLFVGYGTFSPVRVTDIREHVMHAEYVEISGQTVQSLLKARSEKRPVIAIGTTSTRVLEGLAEKFSARACAGELLLEPWKGWLNCFIYPGRPIRVIDGLLTNFHLPESTLLMLAAAFCGRSRLLAAYERAIKARMRFFSYGDAMLIL